MRSKGYLAALEKLFREQRLWQGERRTQTGLSTGFTVLDRVLPAAGWPRGALTELLVDDWGIGELQLLLPAMCTVVAAQGQLAWVAPPFVPYAPALAAAGLDPRSILVVAPESQGDGLWSAEKLLQGADAGMVLIWSAGLTLAAARRLQLAAHSSHSLGILIRLRAGPDGVASAAALRLLLKIEHDPQLLCIKVLKARGSNRRAVVRIPCKKQACPR